MNASPSPHPSPNPLEASDKKLLVKADRDPLVVLRNESFLRPPLALAYLEVCDNMALTRPGRAIEHGKVAVELADRLGDLHFYHQALGVLAHAYSASQAFVEAGQLLSRYEDSALACCPACRSDWLRRKGDFAGELRDIRTSLWLLDGAEAELKKLPADEDPAAADPALGPVALGFDNALGRIRFVRGVSHHHRGDRETAFADVDGALGGLPLDAPRGYFLDGVAFVSCFVAKDDPTWDATASGILERLRRRLVDVRGFTDVRALIRWVEAPLLARSGKMQPAIRRLESVQDHMIEHGRPRDAAAVTFDLLQLLTRSTHDSNVRAAKTALWKGLQREDLPDFLRGGMEEMVPVMDRYPEDAFHVLTDVRDSFIARVPGLLAVLPRLGLAPQPEKWQRVAPDSDPGRAASTSTDVARS